MQSEDAHNEQLQKHARCLHSFSLPPSFFDFFCEGGEASKLKQKIGSADVQKTSSARSKCKSERALDSYLDIKFILLVADSCCRGMLL